MSSARPDILDRNGEIMATDIKTMSVFAEPRRIIDKDEAVELLTAVLPDVDAKDLRDRLGSRKGFVWVKRGVTPQQQAGGLPPRPAGRRLPAREQAHLSQRRRSPPMCSASPTSTTRASPASRNTSTARASPTCTAPASTLTPQDLKPITLSIDLKATQAVRDELAKGIEHFKAKSGAAAIMDVNTGEVIAFASLPDYDPNNPVDALDPNHINHLTVGTYEMGSTFKAISIAMALEANKVTLKSSVDARDNLRYGRFTIHDFHAEHRMLTVPEVFTYSSNIGTARMAMMVGVEGHKAFLRKMGQLDRLRTELPENAEPIVPKNWSELNTITIAFGQGLNVAPLQAMMAVGGLANGGYMLDADLPQADTDDRAQPGPARGAAGGVGSPALPHAPQRRRSARPRRSTSRAISPAARPARPTRSSTATIRRTGCSRPSCRSCRPTSRSTCSWC